MITQYSNSWMENHKKKTNQWWIHPLLSDREGGWVNLQWSFILELKEGENSQHGKSLNWYWLLTAIVISCHIRSPILETEMAKYSLKTHRALDIFMNTSVVDVTLWISQHSNNRITSLHTLAFRCIYTMYFWGFGHCSFEEVKFLNIQTTGIAAEKNQQSLLNGKHTHL